MSGEEQAGISATRALVVQSVPLRLSPEAMARGFYGCALVDFTIDGSGHARGIRVLSSVPGAAFGRSAFAAVALYTFKSAGEEGRRERLLEQDFLLE